MAILEPFIPRMLQGNILRRERCRVLTLVRGSLLQIQDHHKNVTYRSISLDSISGGIHCYTRKTVLTRYHVQTSDN